MGRTVPDSIRWEDPEPARIWSGKVVEQKNGSSTDLRMAWICFHSVVTRCFLDMDRGAVESFWRRCWEITTAGIRPWALSLDETLFPTHSLGIAWIVWYPADDGCDELWLDTAVLRLLVAERHHLVISSSTSANAMRGLEFGVGLCCVVSVWGFLLFFLGV